VRAIGSARTYPRDGRSAGRLVYSAHDEQHNDAVVLRAMLLGEG
jgi:uncharacterized protein YeaO (DUF488 family)